ncbi:hypothetical protein ACP4OV_001917 [Aristida adscensionis]
MSSCSPSAMAAGGGGTSTVAAETVTGWHVLKVEGYSRMKELGVGKRVKSETFIVGGHSWHITLFPDGYDERRAHWICVDLYLECLAVDKKVRAGFKFSLLNEFGEPVPSYSYSRITDSPRTFSSIDYSYGFLEFIKIKDLESLYLKDDSFQVRCDVTVIGNTRVKATKDKSRVLPSPPSSDLHQHLGNLLDSKIGGDVMFQ